MTQVKPKRRTGKWIEPYLYLLPTIVLIGLFSYYPFVKTLYDSLHYISASGSATSFAGFDNYAHVINDSNFVKALGNTMMYVLYMVPITMISSLILALLAAEKRKLSRFYEVMYALPMAMSVATTALIFKFLLNPTVGWMNQVFDLDIQWFADERFALFSISTIEIWMGIGFNFLFMLAAIRNVSRELIESSRMDGANPWIRTIRIRIPLISPTLFFLLCTNLVSAVLISSPIIILTGGGPSGATQSIIYYMYYQGFVAFNYGSAYATSFIGFLVAFFVLLVSFIYEKRGVHYQ